MFARLAKQACSVKGGAAVVGLVVSIPAVGQSLVFAHAESKSEFDRHKVLIIGGGTAGTTVANQLSKKMNGKDIAIVEPSASHFYQPLWTMVGAGLCKKEESKGKTGDFLPKSSVWIQDAVTSFQPEQSSVTLQSGRKLQYDVLVVATGLQIDWNKIPGLKQALDDPTCPVTSIYNYEHSEKTNQVMSQVTNGNVIFTQPAGAIKCGGAPQKIMWLWESKWRESNVRKNINITFSTPLSGMFAVKKYSTVLEGLAAERGVQPLYGTELVSIDTVAHQVALRNAKTGVVTSLPFDAVHVVPPMSPPDVIKASPLAAAASGFVAVDKATLQHDRYPNVFALGDCAALPTSKTAAAISSQVPVVVNNVQRHLEGRPLNAKYDGYTSCPILVGGGKLILAEFKYDSVIAETFGGLFDQAVPSRFAFMLKRYAFPWVYWSSFLGGTWYGPRTWFPPSFPEVAGGGAAAEAVPRAA